MLPMMSLRTKPKKRTGRPNSSAVSLRDVALEANVSTATVSRALASQKTESSVQSFLRWKSVPVLPYDLRNEIRCFIYEKDSGTHRGLTSYGDDEFSLFLRKAFINPLLKKGG